MNCDKYEVAMSTLTAETRPSDMTARVSPSMVETVAKKVCYACVSMINLNLVMYIS